MQDSTIATLTKFKINHLSESLEGLVKPCIKGKLVSSSGGKGISKVGGAPDIAGSFEWPWHNQKPLSFIAQINLSDIKDGLLPPTGLLYFFYDLEGWGFDPKDQGFIQVMYREETDGLTTVQAPSFDKRVLFGLIKKEKPAATFPECKVEFTEGESLPSSEHEQLVKFLEDDAVCDHYCDAKSELTPAVQMFGHPDPVQSDDMELQCQLVTQGVYCGDSSGYNGPQAKELAKGKNDWILLFQLQEDEQTEMVWGDAGVLYYWIKKEDLMAKRFEKAWLVMQCC